MPPAAQTTATRKAGQTTSRSGSPWDRPGKAVDNVFTTLKQQYEEKYPGRTVEIIIQENDTYETIGLNNLLTSRNAPDVYFERPGTRMPTKVDDGYGADITDAVSQPAFTGRFDRSAYSGMTIDGKTYMVPWSGDVTNVFWYNKEIFADNSLTPPTTWARVHDPVLHAQGGGHHAAGRRQQGQVARRQHRFAPGRAHRSAMTPTSPRSWATSR